MLRAVLACSVLLVSGLASAERPRRDVCADDTTTVVTCTEPEDSTVHSVVVRECSDGHLYGSVFMPGRKGRPVEALRVRVSRAGSGRKKGAGARYEGEGFELRANFTVAPRAKGTRVGYFTGLVRGKELTFEAACRR